MPVPTGLSFTVRTEYAEDYVYDFTSGSQIDKDAELLRSIGVEWVRVNMPTFDNQPAVDGMKEYALFYKSKGFKCRVGIVDNGTTAVDITRWNLFLAAIPDFAEWAQDNDMDALCIGNEAATHNDKTTNTNANVFSTMVAMATTVKAIFTNGPICYDASAGEIVQTWHPSGLGGLGDIDRIGHNQYDSLSNFTSKIRTSYDIYGDRLDVTEWSIDNGFNGTNMKSEPNFTKDMAARMKTLMDLGIEHYYYFSLRDGGNGVVANSYAMFKTNGDTRTAFPQIIKTGRIGITV
jgi:hypothetical protein